MMQPSEQYIELFNQYKNGIESSCGEVMNSQREVAIKAFEKSGFPDVGMEDYRNCDLKEVLSYDYGVNLKRVKINVNPHDVFKCDVPNLSTKLFFIVNDQFHKEERAVTFPEGVICGSLNDFSKSHKDLVSKFYNKLASQSDDGMVSFNTAFLQDGLFVYVPANVKLEKPIQIIQVLYGNEDILVQRRVLVVLEEGASAKLLFCDHSLAPHRFLTNMVSELYLGKNANLEYYELEMSHENTTRVCNTFSSVDSGASLLQNGITLSNGITRNNINVRFEGEYAEAKLSGLALGEKSQIVDNHIFIDHAQPHCVSNQLYKYVLDDSSKGVFGGKIMVRKDAQKTAAYQSNRNLCITKDSKMFSRPQLVIYADDVKCSHGSATGQIDENALFYLRSRGISEHEARMLMKYAFTSDVTDAISLDPLKERMKMLVEKRFRGELARCAGCTVNNCK